MHRKQNVLFALAALALSAGSLSANNVVVLPTYTGSPTGTAIVYSADPFKQLTTFNVSTDAFLVLPRPAQAAGDTKYYVISRSGSGSLTILNRDFQAVGNPINLGQNVTAAAVTPDGRRLLIVFGNNLKQYRTDTDAEIQTSFIDVGINPTEMAVSPDSRRAFVFSAAAQRVTAVDLNTNLAVGSIPLPGLPPDRGSMAMGPNGMLYISASNRVLEIDPRATPFEGGVRRTWALSNANVGKLQFTPDGTRALALNLSAQTGPLIYYFQLDYVYSGINTLSSSDAGLNGFVFEKLYVAGNNLAYVITSANSAKARRLFPITIPAFTQSATSIPSPSMSTDDAFFASLGTVPIVDSLAFSPETPQPIRGFISAPLNQLQSGAQNTIYSFVYTSNGANVTGQFPITFLPGPVTYAGPSPTSDNATAGGFIRIGTNQPSVASKGKTLPFGLQVLTSSGAPMYNVPVVFTALSGGASFDGPSTVTTNSQGYAFVTANAPEATGDFTINVSVQGTGLSTTFTFNVPVTGGGGSNNGGGTGGGQARINILDGNGVVLRQGDFAPRGDGVPKYTIAQVLDPAGKPLANSAVTWTVAQGGGRWREGTYNADALTWTTTTDANGLTQNSFQGADYIDTLTTSFAQSVATVSAGAATTSVFFTTLSRTDNSGFPTPFPSPRRLTPVNDPPSIIAKAGQTISGAIRYQFTNGGTLQNGAPLQYIGLTASTGNKPTDGPVVACDPTPVAISNEQGIATCDLKISGKAGTANVRLELGGGFSIGQDPFILLQVNPGDPSRLVINNGDKQSGNPNATLPAQLIVTLDDGGGNVLAGATVRWEIIQGQAIFGSGTTSTTTITNQNGQALNTVRLGTQPGIVLVRATALGGIQPSVTFELRVNVTAATLTRVSGDSQTTFTNSAFGQALVVKVTDSQNNPVSGQVVNFTVNSGSATLSANSGTTGTDGTTQVTVRAGANPGPIQVTASAASLPNTTVVFTLNAQLPGPIVNPLDFYNAASGERGSVVPGGLYTITGTGLAPDLKGCASGNTGLPGPYPTRVANVEVQFASFLAPIVNVCNVNGREQVTVQVPYELAAGANTPVTIRVGGGSSVVNGVQVLDLQPGIFETVDGQGRRYATAVRPNGTYITPENPAQWGEVIRFYITGGGQSSPAGTTGVPGVANQNIVAPVIVGLNDAGARLDSVRYQIGTIGIYEVAMEIPFGTPTGPDRPLGFLLVRSNGQVAFPANSPVIPVAPSAQPQQ